MLEPKIKNIKYDTLEVIRKYFELGLMTERSDLSNPEKSTVLAVIAELYVKITKKLLFCDKSKLYSIKFTPSQAMAFIAYAGYMEITNVHTQVIVLEMRNNLIKQIQ